MKDNKISLVLDVGANEGQYGAIIRTIGYNSNIISFEPIKSVFQTLFQRSKYAPNWLVRNEALGDFDGYTEINISSFSQTSSIFPATGLASTAYWKSKVKEKICVRRLDSLVNELAIDSHRVLLKIDTQGFEEKVLLGCQNILQRNNIILLEVELFIQQFYTGEKLFSEMLMYIRSLGFELVSMNPVHIDSNRGYVLQYDCTFIRKTILNDGEGNVL
jgi:FkbM family methyltransferase